MDELVRCCCGVVTTMEMLAEHTCKPSDPTIEQMIEEMRNTHICTGGGNVWWTYIEPFGLYEDGKGNSPFAAIHALYKKWKEQ